MSGAQKPPVLDLVIPVYNEQRTLTDSVRKAHDYIADNLPFSARITIADNASTDRTWELAQNLEGEFANVRAVRLEHKGRGRALNRVWSQSDAEVLAYMDVDLSTELSALLPLVAPLVSGHSEVAIGSRLARGSRVRRGPKREFISRVYNLLLRSILAVRFSDAQCGFKAIRADVAKVLLPRIQNTRWFFDTEMLVLAEKSGMRIHEVPVDWVDDPDSRVDIRSTVAEDLAGIWRLASGAMTGKLPVEEIRASLVEPDAQTDERDATSGLVPQLLRFAVIGVFSTVAYAALYAACRQIMPAQLANFLALLTTAIANTAANRRFTFRVRGRSRAARQQAQGLIVFAIGWVLTSVSLALLHNFAPTVHRAVEVLVLICANLAATVLKFLLFRGWIFGRRRHQDPKPDQDTTAQGTMANEAHDTSTPALPIQDTAAPGASLAGTATQDRPGGEACLSPNESAGGSFGRDTWPRRRWEWPALAGVLLITAVAYCYRLTAGGWTNVFYAGAVQAGAQSWPAALFGASDPSLGISIDKPPASLWLPELAVRLFGLSPWTLLLPEVLLGLASVWLLWACVRRYAGPAAALIASIVLATTPVATLMFRFNNPDALLTFLLLIATWATLRGIESGRSRWSVIVGTAIGFAFLTKQLQAFLVVPALLAVYLLASRLSWGKRLRECGFALAALVVSAGWWVGLVELLPPDRRPYVGGSATNSFWDLTFGYNGAERIGQMGSNGPTVMPARLLANPATASQIGWLLPAAIALAIFLLWSYRRRPRTDLPRAAVAVWAGSLGVTAVVFSAMVGLFHPYYAVALAPAIGALVGIGVEELWAQRERRSIRWGAAAIVVGTAAYSVVLQTITAPHWQPWLRIAIPLAALIGAALVVWLGSRAGDSGRRAHRPVLVAGAAMCLLSMVAGPMAYSAATLPLNHSGTRPLAGPTSAVQSAPDTGPGSAYQPNEVQDFVHDSADGYRWSAAMIGSRPAAGLQLGSGRPVLAIGGFSARDPYPTLSGFQQDISQGRIHYFVEPAKPTPPPSGTQAAAIQTWVHQEFQPVLVDGNKVYDLTAPASPER